MTAVCVGRRRVAFLCPRQSILGSRVRAEPTLGTQPDTPRMAAQPSPHRRQIPSLLSGSGGEAVTRCCLCLPWQGVPGVLPVSVSRQSPLCSTVCQQPVTGRLLWHHQCSVVVVVTIATRLYTFTLDVNTNHIYWHNLYGWTRICCWNDCQWYVQSLSSARKTKRKYFLLLLYIALFKFKHFPFPNVSNIYFFMTPMHIRNVQEVKRRIFSSSISHDALIWRRSFSHITIKEFYQQFNGNNFKSGETAFPPSHLKDINT